MMSLGMSQIFALLFVLAFAQTENIANVTVTTKRPLRGIDSTFLGLSYEKSTLSLSLFEEKNKDLVTLFTRLGQGVLRLGGNSVDKTGWAKSDIDRLAGFLKKTQWKVIYGINLAKNTPENAAEEAEYANKALGSSLIAFEIGNEPDLYSIHGHRSANYTYQDFKKEWESYVEAIRKKIPDAKFSGPTTTDPGLETFLVPFAKDQKEKLETLAQHYYLADGKSKTSTMELLLTPDKIKLPKVLGTVSAAAKSAGLGFRISEANSFFNGGAAGVSNAFGSALWAIDFLFKVAATGAVGVNFHGGGDSPGYTPIATKNGAVKQIRPVYLGMYLFSQAARGNIVKAEIDNTDLQTYATADKDEFRVVIINKTKKSFFAWVTFDQQIHKAKTFDIKADTAMNVSETWRPYLTPLKYQENKLNIGVSAGSAVLIQAVKK